MFIKKNIQNSVQAVDVNLLVDFTLLDPRATTQDIEKLCDIAFKNRYYSVCVNPVNVKYAKGYIFKNFENKLKVCCVVGFPLGANSLQTKLFEAKTAIEDGADEIDFVINIGKAKERDFAYIKNEITKVRKISKKHILKVIIETCYFDDNDIVKLCKICENVKVDFVKTSTGFGTGGANEHVIKLMKSSLNRCKIKASGGIRTREQAVTFINLGAERIGTSHIIWFILICFCGIM